MPTGIELRAVQKRTLHAMLRIKHEAAGITLKELDSYISTTIAEMEAEDVAYVEKIVAKLLDQ